LPSHHDERRIYNLIVLSTIIEHLYSHCRFLPVPIAWGFVLMVWPNYRLFTWRRDCLSREWRLGKIIRDLLIVITITVIVVAF